MGLFEHFPYTNFHELNLGWLLDAMKKLKTEFDNLSKEQKEQIEEIVKTLFDDVVTGLSYDPVTKTINLSTNPIGLVGGDFDYLQIGATRYKLAAPEIDTDRRYIFIGDSYNTSYHHGGWGLKVQALLNIPDTRLISQGVGGASFAGSVPYINQLMAITADLTTAERAAITDIVVAGGANEWSHSSNAIAAAIVEFEQYVTSNYPNAKLWIMNIGWAYLNDSIREGIIDGYRAYNRYVSKAALIDGIYRDLFVVTYLEDDMVHPTNAGLNLLAGNIARALRSDPIMLQSWAGTLWHRFSNDDGDDSITIYANPEGSGFKIRKLDQTALVFNTTKTLTNSWVKIATLSSTNYAFERSCEVLADALIIEGSGGPSSTFIPSTIKCRVSRDGQGQYGLYVRMINIPAGTTSYNVSCNRLYLRIDTTVPAYQM